MIEQEIEAIENKVRELHRWYRLLYDDGFSLEEIVKEAFENLDAQVTKASPEKDDYRITVTGYPEGVMEVKGSKNPQMVRDDLRQLNDWVQQAIADKLGDVKGIFVGNAGRNSDPQSRGELFDANNYRYAKMQKMVTLRSLDLYVLTILRMVNKLDMSSFWKEFFACDGPFDAEKYWKALPADFGLTTHPLGGKEEQQRGE